MASKKIPAEDSPQSSDTEDGSKRNFLKLILTLGGVATVGSFASMFRILEFVPPPNAGSNVPLAWPVVKITNISSLDLATPVRFNYPLVETPSVLLKLGVQAENGVGPDGDIVAFSNICQHLGCFYSILPAAGDSPPCNSSFKSAGPQGYCCCHGGQYDFVHGGKVIGGPPPRPVPMVVLKYDSSTGDIYATGMTAPTIFGHGTPGTTDPATVLQDDLTGGTIVTDSTALSTS